MNSIITFLFNNYMNNNLCSMNSNLCSMNSDNSNYILCNTIQDNLLSLISDYNKTTKLSSFTILTHSGSAPVKGWINNGLGGYNKIADAIHKYAVDKHEYAAIHYRDNYLWHAWLKINTNNFKFNYRKNPTIEILPELVNISKNKFSEKFHYNDHQSQFIKDFTDLNTKFPDIGILHRCLIIIRYLNENFDKNPSILMEMIQLQQIYYPLFHFVNLFIHIVFLNMAYGQVDYYILYDYESSIIISKNNSLKELTLLDKSHPWVSYDDYNNKNHKFNNIQKKLGKIITKHYTIILSINKDIYSLVKYISTKIGVNISELETPYLLFKAPKQKSTLKPNPRPPPQTFRRHSNN